MSLKVTSAPEKIKLIMMCHPYGKNYAQHDRYPWQGADHSPSFTTHVLFDILPAVAVQHARGFLRPFGGMLYPVHSLGRLRRVVVDKRLQHCHRQREKVRTSTRDGGLNEFRYLKRTIKSHFIRSNPWFKDQTHGVCSSVNSTMRKEQRKNHAFLSRW